MTTSFLNEITKRFLLSEKFSPTAKSYFQSLSDLVEQIRPSSKKDSYRLELAKENLSKLRKSFRKMEENIISLQEQVNLLEEQRGE